MNCIRVRTCCFMCSVTTGSKVFGWLITLASTAGIIYVAATFESLFPMPVAIGLLCFLALVLFGGIVLLVGIYSESSNAVLGALIILVLVFIGAVILSIPFTQGYIAGTLPLVETLPVYIGIILIILVYGYSIIILNNFRLLIKERFIQEVQDEVLVINRKGGGTRRLTRAGKRRWHKEKKIRRIRKKGKFARSGMKPIPSYTLRPRRDAPRVAEPPPKRGGEINIKAGGGGGGGGGCSEGEGGEIVFNQEAPQVMVMQPPPEPPPLILEQVPVPIHIVFPPEPCECPPGVRRLDCKLPYCVPKAKQRPCQYECARLYKELVERGEIEPYSDEEECCENHIPGGKETEIFD